MIKLYDKRHNRMEGIAKYKDLKIESDLITGDKTLTFTYIGETCSAEPECYLVADGIEYIVKEKKNDANGRLQYAAILNLEDLESVIWKSFSVVDVPLVEAAELALEGTGWRVGECTVTKKRTAGMTFLSSRDVIDKLCKVWMCERIYDTAHKTVSFHQRIGTDRGVYFMKGMNLKKLRVKSDSYDYYTRIIPLGANGLTIESVNDGKDYLENYQYSEKVRPYIWRDESYTDPQSLKEDAELKLEDLSRPVTEYQTEIRDLAKQSRKYSILAYELGDTVTLIDAAAGIREKQRIVKITEYPYAPEKNTCELSNTTPTFDELQQRYREAAEIAGTFIGADGRYNGTINVSDILHFEEGLAKSSTVSQMKEGYKEMSEAIEGDEGILKRLEQIEKLLSNAIVSVGN